MTARRYPYLRFYPDDYFADTTELTLEQHGIYLILLLQAWRDRDCSLPDDVDRIVAGITNCSAFAGVRRPGRALRANVLAVLGKYFRRTLRDDGRSRWVQGRLLREREHVKNVSSKRATAGARARHKDLKSHDPDEPSEQQLQSYISESESEEEREERKIRQTPAGAANCKTGRGRANGNGRSPDWSSMSDDELRTDLDARCRELFGDMGDQWAAVLVRMESTLLKSRQLLERASRDPDPAMWIQRCRDRRRVRNRGRSSI